MIAAGPLGFVQRGIRAAQQILQPAILQLLGTEPDALLQHKAQLSLRTLSQLLPLPLAKVSAAASRVCESITQNSSPP